MKFCIIRKVAFKMPGQKSRIVWANVLCEREGLAMLLVPKLAKEQPHLLVIATENVAERVFESVGQVPFRLQGTDLEQVGQSLRLLGRSLWKERLDAMLAADDFDPNDWDDL